MSEPVFTPAEAMQEAAPKVACSACGTFPAPAPERALQGTGWLCSSCAQLGMFEDGPKPTGDLFDLSPHEP